MSTPQDRRLLPPAPTRYSALKFVHTNTVGLQSLWSLLGLTWTNTLETNGLAAEDLVLVGREHGKYSDKVKAMLAADPELENWLKQALTELSMFEGSDFPEIPADVSSELVVAAGTYKSMPAQMAAFLPGLVSGELSFDHVYYLTGCRPRTDRQDGTRQQIVDGLTPSVRNHWWVVQELEKPEPTVPDGYTKPHNEYPRLGGAFDTEAKLVILALLLAADNEIKDLSFDPVREGDNGDQFALECGLPERDFMSCTITLRSGQTIIIVNGPAAKRENDGPPRPTSKSTQEYRLRYWPPKLGAWMCTVSLPTHGLRVTGTLERELHQGDYPDITVYGTWRSIANDEDEIDKRLPNALGEAVMLVINATREQAAHGQTTGQ